MGRSVYQIERLYYLLANGVWIMKQTHPGIINRFSRYGHITIEKGLTHYWLRFYDGYSDVVVSDTDLDAVVCKFSQWITEWRLRDISPSSCPLQNFTIKRVDS